MNTLTIEAAAILKENNIKVNGAEAKAGVPITGDEASTIWDNLSKILVSTMLTSQLRTIPDYKMFQDSDWTNGQRLFYMSDLVNDENFKKTIDINDFNPNQPDNQEIKVGIDFQKIFRTQTSPIQLLEAWTTTGKASAFLAKVIGDLKNAAKVFMFDQMTKYLLEQPIQTGSTTDMVYDKIFDTAGLTTTEIMKLASEYVAALATPSSTHTLLGYKYTANAKNLTMIVNTKFQPEIDFDLTAALFKYNEIEIKFGNLMTVDFAQYETTTGEYDGIKFMIIDNDAVKKGDSVALTWSTKAPLAKILTEYHTWFGMTKLPNYAAAIFLDVAPAVMTMIAQNENNWTAIADKIHLKTKGKNKRNMPVIVKPIINIPSTKNSEIEAKIEKIIEATSPEKQDILIEKLDQIVSSSGKATEKTNSILDKMIKKFKIV